jgi:hypothetical protein
MKTPTNVWQRRRKNNIAAGAPDPEVREAVPVALLEPVVWPSESVWS